MGRKKYQGLVIITSPQVRVPARQRRLLAGEGGFLGIIIYAYIVQRSLALFPDRTAVEKTFQDKKLGWEGLGTRLSFSPFTRTSNPDSNPDYM